MSRGHFSRKSAFSVRLILKGQGTPLKHEGNTTGPPAAGLESGSHEALAASPHKCKNQDPDFVNETPARARLLVGDGVGGALQDPAAIGGRGGSLCSKGSQKGIKAGCGSKHVAFWKSLVLCAPSPARRWSFSFSGPVYLCVTNICFYVFLGPLSFVSSINTSRSGEDKQGHNHAIK